MSRTRTPAQTVIGTVSSDRMQKTISVRLDRVVEHARYGKYLRRYSVVKAHDEHEKAGVGDVVEIAFTRRLSKTKNWRLVRIVREGRVEAVRGDEEREAIASRPVQRPAPRTEASEPEVRS